MEISIALLVFLLLIMLFSLIAYIITFYTSAKQKAMGAHLFKDGSNSDNIKVFMDKVDSTPCEWVYIDSHDGKRLAARYIHSCDGAPLHIQFHGYRGSSTRDFCGGNLLARARGHNTLLIEQRAHSKSDGHTITFGIKERIDCLKWIKYAVKRFGDKTPIILSGISMGASTVLMAGEFDLPKNVVGIIADSPFSSPSDIIKNECANMGLSPKLVFPFIRLGGLIFGRFDVCKASSLEAVKKCTKPVLIIHGEADTFVPLEMGKKLYENCASQNKRFASFPNANHGYSYIVDGKRYEAIVDEFLAEIL